MIGGMVIIVGGVFVVYVGFFGGFDLVVKQMFVIYLFMVLIIFVLVVIVVVKMFFFFIEKVDLEYQKLDIFKQEVGSNLFDVILCGIIDGLKLVINVGVMLLVFIVFIVMFNYIFINWIGGLIGFNEIVQ